MQALLEAHLPGLGPQQRQWILDATAVAAYHADLEFPVVRLLVCDDAPQFTLVTEELALCWVHEGRHYKKLVPYVPHHRALVEDFVQRFWTYYDQLLAYREQPTPEEAVRLDGEFEAVFSTVTGYERIGRADCQDPCQEGLPADGADAPGNPPAQQPGRTGSAGASTQTGCELRATHPRGRQGVGHLHDTGGDRDQAGGQFLSLHP